MSFAYENVTVEQSKKQNGLFSLSRLLSKLHFNRSKEILQQPQLSQKTPTMIMETCIACFVGTVNFETSSQLEKKTRTTKTRKTQTLRTSRREKKPHIHTYKNISRTIKSTRLRT